MKLNPYLAIFMATFIFGTSGAIVKFVNLSAAQLSFFRMGIPTVFLFFWLSYRGIRLFTGSYRLLMVASVLNAIRMFFFFAGYNLTSIGNAVILLYTWPAFSMIFSHFILKEKLYSRNIFLLFVAFAGIILVASKKELSFSSDSFLGMGSMLISAAIYAMTVVIFKKESNHFSTHETIFYQNFIGTFVFLPFLFFDTPVPNAGQVAIASLYGFWIGIMAFTLFIGALAKLKASTASFLAYFEVLFSIFFGIVFYQETLSMNMVIGGILILGSSMLIKK